MFAVLPFLQGYLGAVILVPSLWRLGLWSFLLFLSRASSSEVPYERSLLGSPLSAFSLGFPNSSFVLRLDFRLVSVLWLFALWRSDSTLALRLSSVMQL